MNTSKKAVCVPQLSDALLVLLNIFKYIDGIIKNFISNLSIDEEITHWRYTMALVGVFIMKENNLITNIIRQEL